MGKIEIFLVNKCVVCFNMRLHFREIFQFQSASDFLLQSLLFVLRLKDISITKNLQTVQIIKYTCCIGKSVFCLGFHQNL